MTIESSINYPYQFVFITRDYYNELFTTGKKWRGKSMGELSKTRRFIPVIIIPSEVFPHKSSHLKTEKQFYFHRPTH
jgi:hypothetical protein